MKRLPSLLLAIFTASLLSTSTSADPSADASEPSPRTEPQLQCLLGFGRGKCWRDNGCYRLERVVYLGTNSAGADVYEARYNDQIVTYVLYPPGPDGKSKYWFRPGSHIQSFPRSVEYVASRIVRTLIYTRPQNLPPLACPFYGDSFN